MVRTLADCVRLVLGPCRPEAFNEKCLNTRAGSVEHAADQRRGCGNWSSRRRFLQAYSRRSQTKKMHLIDPWQYQAGKEFAEAYYGGKAKGGQTELDSRYLRVLQRFQPEIQNGQVEVHRGFSKQVAVESGWWKGSVERAVDEFASNNIVKIVSLQHSQFCLEKTQPATK